MLRVIPYIVISGIIYIMLIYMQDYQPEELEALIIKFDIMGLTNASKYEHYRQNKIKTLNGIGATEKEILLNHTVFLGATAEMVEYALGPPKLLFKDRDSSPVHRIFYVYFLVGDKRPTMFEFACTANNPEECKSTENKSIFVLSKAYKKSTIDFDIDSSNAYTPLK